MEEERNKHQTFSADGWTGESKIFTNVVKKWARTPLSRAKNSKNKWAEWLGRGAREGDKGPRSFVLVGDTNQDKRGAFIPVGSSNRDKRPRGPFVPVGASNRDKRPPFYPGWCLQPGQKAPVPPLARLAIGPGTKATYCPGLNSCRDKWSGTNAYSVVVHVIIVNLNNEMKLSRSAIHMCSSDL